MDARKIEAAALKLGMQARARIAKKLLDSLETLSEKEIEELWIEEALRRLKATDAGKTKTIPLAQVMRRLRRRIA